MKILLWFWLSCKRQMKRPVFVLLLVLLPILVYGARHLEQEDESGIAIGLYGEDDGIGREIIEKLVSGQTMFTFYQCDSREALEADVAARRAECGYVFFEGLDEKLASGSFKRSIGVYSAPSTVVASLSTEVVFAALMEVYGRDLLEGYMTSSELFAGVDGAWQETEALYDKYYQNGSTFSFRYETMDQKPMDQKSVKAAFPTRGIAAVYIFVIGLFSAVTLCADEKNGLFIPVAYPVRSWCKLASMLAPVALASVSALCGLWLSGAVRDAWYELGVLAAYGMSVAAFGYLLKCVIKNPVMLCSMIPFFILGSLVLCPVFLDVSRWVPEAGALGRLFLPYYYLKAFALP